jgi:hypothetical protein
MAPFGANRHTEEQLLWPYRVLDFDLFHPLDLCRPAALVALFQPFLCLVAAEVRIRESTPKRISGEIWAQLRPCPSGCEYNPTPENPPSSTVCNRRGNLWLSLREFQYRKL